jgi:hypothetical protein
MFPIDTMPWDCTHSLEHPVARVSDEDADGPGVVIGQL